MQTQTLLNKEYFLTKAQFAARQIAGTLEVGATYNITDDIDATPTEDSDNLVTSGGVYDAIEGHHDSSKQDKIDASHKLPYNLLSDTPAIPAKTSDLTNDSGFLTQHQSLSAYRTSAAQDDIDAGKANKTPIATPASAQSYELAVDTMTNLGELSGAVSLTLATEPSDGKVHIYAFTFSTGATAPTITWPSGISWQGSSAPTINANKAYEVSVCQLKTLISEY